MAVSFGEMVGDGRRAKGRSLRDLAAELDLSPSYLNDIEHGRRVPSAPKVRAIAVALDLDADSLLAAAGRVGDEAEGYLKDEPQAGVLLRTAADGRLSEAELQQLIKSAKKIIRDRDPE